MMRLRILLGVLTVTLILCGGVVRADDQKQPSADEQLAKAVQLYKAGDYDKAHELLSGIKADDLSDEDQQLEYQKYMSLTDQAIKSIAAAKEQWTRAEESLKAKDT